MLKKVLVWGLIAFVIFFIAFKPGAAAAVLGVIGQAAIDIFKGVGDFFGGLAP